MSKVIEDVNKNSGEIPGLALALNIGADRPSLFSCSSSGTRRHQEVPPPERRALHRHRLQVAKVQQRIRLRARQHLL